EENVVQIARCEGCNLLCQLEGEGMPKLEGRCVVQGAQLLGDSLLDLFAGMASAAGPKPGKTVKNFPTLVVVQPVSLCADDDSGVFLEGSVGAERHPVRAQIQ